MVADSNYIHTPQRISYPSNNEVYPLNLKIMIEHLILLVKRAGLEPTRCSHTYLISSCNQCFSMGFKTFWKMPLRLMKAIFWPDWFLIGVKIFYLTLGSLLSKCCQKIKIEFSSSFQVRCDWMLFSRIYSPVFLQSKVRIFEGGFGGKIVLSKK